MWQEPDSRHERNMSIGMAIGVGLGAVMSLLFVVVVDSPGLIGVGAAVGVSIGVSIGTALNQREQKNNG